MRVDKPGELAEAVENAFVSCKPAFVDVITDKREYPPFGTHRHVAAEQLSRFPVY